MYNIINGLQIIMTGMLHKPIYTLENYYNATSKVALHTAFRLRTR